MIEQRTPEWLEMRKNYLGGSDAPVIMGVCPFKIPDGRVKTPHVLWEEKLGLLDTNIDNANVRFGAEMEEKIVEWYENETTIPILPSVEFHPAYKYMMASVDGLNKKAKKVVEIKCANKDDHASAKEGKVPEKYYPQVQHILSVVNALYGIETLDYVSFHQGDYHMFEVPIDREYLDVLHEKEVEFWGYVDSLKEPPLCEKDFVIRDSEWEKIAYSLWELKESKKEIDAQIKEQELLLQSLSEDRNSRSAEYRYTLSERKGSIDYAKIPELKSLDLETYRKKSSKVWRLTKESK